MPRLLAIQVPWSGTSDLVPALEALVTLNVTLIPLYRCPPLYSGGIVYQREARKDDGSYFERWLTAPEVVRHGHGDCEDLASYLAAQYRLAGDVAAIAMPIRNSIGWHIVTRRGNGTIEDPSKRLGM